MQTRKCGKTGLEFSVISFGGMRIGGKEIKPFAEIVAEAAKAGMNYFETSCGYCGGTSEVKIGEGLKGFPREKVYISTKCAPRDYPTADAARKVIDQSLKRLGVEYLDFYQLWDTKLAEFRDIAAKKGGTLEGVRKAMGEGLIRHLGITTHDTPEKMITLLETGEFESVTVQYNLMNRTAEPVIAFAAEKRIGVIAMGPLHGGILATKGSFVDELVEKAAGESPAEVAIRFALTNPGVTCVISGVATIADVESDARIAARLRPLTRDELAMVDARAKAFVAASGKVCTLCEYCMPCPKDICIPDVMTLANASRLLGLHEDARRQYAKYVKGWAEAGSDGAPCVECGHCVERCPQGIDVPKELKRAHELLK